MLCFTQTNKGNFFRTHSYCNPVAKIFSSDELVVCRTEINSRQNSGFLSHPYKVKDAVPFGEAIVFKSMIGLNLMNIFKKYFC